MRTTRTFILTAVALGFVGKALAGEVSGLPQTLGPAMAPDYAYFLGNDFAALGTSDDYRTGQMAITGRFGEDWVAVLDHSIFTRKDEVGDRFGRVDTMTISLGYEVLGVDEPDYHGSLLVGGALRGIGNFEGERMQNGFHRLIVSDIERLDYTGTEEVDPAGWFLGEYHRIGRRGSGDDFISSWDLGYWARAGALVTADGQVDAVAGLYAVAKRRQVDLWLGLRRDWRSGYDLDFVLDDAAREEAKLGVAFGARFGALVIETVQRIDSSASYGQLSFVSSAKTRGDASASGPARADFQASLQVPHVTFTLASRWFRRVFTQADSQWGESLQIEFRAGQPQLKNNSSLFVETAQATFGVEWSRPLATDWLRFYSNLGAGARSERLLLRSDDERDESGSELRAVASVETGLEFDAALTLLLPLEHYAR